MEKKFNVEISVGIILKTILVLLMLWFLYLIRDVLALLFIAVIIVSVLNPMVNFLKRKHIPRSIGVAIIYVILFLIISILVSSLIFPAMNQARDFSQNWPVFAENVSNFFGKITGFFQTQHINFGSEQIFGELSSKTSSISGGIFSTTVGVFSGFVSTIVVLVLAFYMLVKENGIRHFVVFVTPEKYKEYAGNLTSKIEDKIGKWVQGQLAVMIIVAMLVFIGLWAVGVPYALFLAIIAGLLEIVPFIGAIVSSVIGIILGFTVSPVVGISAAIVYIIIHQVEGNILVPQIMKKVVGLNPIAVILVLMIGAKLGGVLGIVLSVPIATAASVFIEDLFKDKA
ncbi:MAG: AI-2E family transporter [Candidatus Moranbacteria bacterium]|nr:AI-2E family transporter [Candidatus Moranbacteria bacterium]